MGNTNIKVCKKCGTTNYGVLYKCLKCGAPLSESGEDAETLVDFQQSRFEAPTIIEQPSEEGAYIEIISGPDAGNHYTLGSGLTFGRSKNCDIVIDSPKVSREHAKITQNKYLQWLLEDLESMNGTVLNNRRIASPTVLYNGDEFSISDSTFRVAIRKTYLKGAQPSKSDTDTEQQKHPIEPLPPRKGCLSNSALIIVAVVLLTACLCSFLYFGYDFLADLGIFIPLR